MPVIPTVTLPDHTRVPAFGLGTWNMGERERRASQEEAALALGLDLGMTLVDTAEMYADGGAEELVGRVIRGRRDRIFMVSKVYPHNAGHRSAIDACERSLARLAIERIDLYLLHWRGRVPLAETIGAFEQLKKEGKIARWGVSNFDTGDMEELFALPEGGDCATNQVLYHLGERGIEWSLLPWMRARKMPVMAYSPLGQGELLEDRRLARIASRIRLAPAQLALAWLAQAGDVIVIPKSSDPVHVRANRAAVDVALDAATLTELDDVFPPPSRARPLAML